MKRLAAGGLAVMLAACSGAVAAPRVYPWHTGIVATTFWVGEILNPTAHDGSQEVSTYDPNWQANYGGCDGVVEQASAAPSPG